MRIGVDVRALTGPLVGIGRYTSCLLDELIRYPGISWFLYSVRPIVHAVGESAENANIVVRQFDSSNRIWSLYGSQVQYSRWAKADDLDVFWSPRHHLPFFLPSKMKKVVTVHDMVWIRFPETMMFANRILESILMPKSLKIADQVIAVSEATKTDVCAYYSPALSKIKVIHEAVYKVTQVKPSNRTNRYFLFVGTLEPRKNLDKLVQAFLQYRAKGGDCELLVVGGSGWKQKNIVGDTVKDAVQVLGYVCDEELATLYKYAEALLLPSLYEGFGLTALEAMQYGTPVIGANRGAIPEVVGQAGLLVEPTSSDDICRAMQEISGNRDLRDALGRQAKAESRKYSWQKAASETMAIFSQLVA